MAGSPSSSPTLVSASTELVARHLPARASLSTDLRIPTASERLREPKLTHAWGLPGKRIISSAGEGGIFKEERTEMLSPTGVSVEPDTSNPTWGAGGEPLTPCPGPASSPGSGWVWASQALCNRDAAEGRAEERTQGGRSCVGGGVDSHLSFLGLALSFREGAGDLGWLPNHCIPSALIWSHLQVPEA